MERESNVKQGDRKAVVEVREIVIDGKEKGKTRARETDYILSSR